MTNSNQPQRRRARKTNGTYQGDNPNTSVNEAYEPSEIESGLEKKIDYSIKTKVDSISDASAGKYEKKEKIRPSFNGISTTYH
jgi:hypothetical protein